MSRAIYPVLVILGLWMMAGSTLAEDLPLGDWQVRLDEADQGVQETWYAMPLEKTDPVSLPGSLAASGIGYRFDRTTGRHTGTRTPYLKWPAAGYTDAHRVDELGTLVPDHFYLGPAWFETTFTASRERRILRLTLERVKWTSRLWINGVEIAGQGNRSLHTPHVYEFLPVTRETPYRLTLRIDNRPPVNIGIAGHGYGMETEPIWHGIAGTIRLEALARDRVEILHLHPTRDGVTVQLSRTSTGPMMLQATLTGPREVVLGESNIPIDPGTTPVEIRVPFNQVPPTWDEFSPRLLTLRVQLREGATPVSTNRVRFGIRDLQQDGSGLRINGRPLFLRGNLDCAIHPATDTPPTDRAWWERVLTIHKQAGFNHIRFHTWCPPERAFEVADELGLYLQVETAYWVDNWIHDTAPHPPRIGEDVDVDDWVLEESRRIIRTYGHHPSFAFFCLGNEFGMGSDWAAIDHIVEQLQSESDTILMSGTTARKTGAHDAYWVTHATSQGGTRGLGPAHTDWDFSRSLQGIDKPVIAHETGQRQSWPDYETLLPAFTGVMQPVNLERLRQRAEAAGISDHTRRAQASAQFARILYKAEHEGMRRTPGMDGYQLLMLHDFTGQGEAFVGLLDPFYREKPGIRLEDIRSWNAPSMPLARFPSFLWTPGQTFAARLQFAHEGPDALHAAPVSWVLQQEGASQPFAEGSLPPVTIQAGSLVDLGSMEVPLQDLPAPARLNLVVTAGTFTNQWPLWVYPDPQDPTPLPPGVVLTRRIDQAALDALGTGQTVLFLYHQGTGPRFHQTRWGSTFWTGAWGWGSGLGLLCDPAHPALAGFPNQGHSDWPWRELAEGGTCLSLNPRQAEPATLIEHLSTFHHPSRQAFLLEARVGPGRLLACGFDLEHDLATRPAARAFRASLLAYALAADFQPRLTLSPEEAATLFALPEPLDAVARADSEAPGFEASRVLDGRPETLWHTRWGAIEPPHPHQLVLAFKEAGIMNALHLKGRMDGRNGRLAEISVYVAQREGHWGDPVLDHAALADHGDWQQLTFSPTPGRFLKIVTHRDVSGQPWASLAEVNVVFE